MVALNRRSMLKTVGAAAAAAFVGGLATSRRARAADPEFLTRIVGNDEADPLTPALTKVHVGIRKVAENLYVLLGAGGNIGLLDGKDGAIVIDSGLPDRAKDVAAAIGIVAKNPANLLINTHFHFDHTGGNEAVHAIGCRIIAQENARKHLCEKTSIDFLQASFEPAPEAARPTIAFEENLSLYANGESLKIVRVAPAHTDGDAFILFEKSGVIQAGDIFFGGFYPFIDYTNGGSLNGMIAAEEKLLSIVDDKMKIIPGHGPVSTKADLQKELDMLKTVRDMLAPLIASSKSVDELVASKPLANLEGKFSKGFLDDDTFVKLIYMCYTKGQK